MAHDSLPSGDAPRLALVRTVAVFGMAIPAVVVALLYAGSSAAGVEFGNVVFLLTLLALFAGGAVYSTSGRMGASRPSSEMYGESHDGVDPEKPQSRRVAGPARLVLVLVGTVVIGWGFLLAAL